MPKLTSDGLTLSNYPFIAAACVALLSFVFAITTSAVFSDFGACVAVALAMVLMWALQFCGCATAVMYSQRPTSHYAQFDSPGAIALEGETSSEDGFVDFNEVRTASSNKGCLSGRCCCVWNSCVIVMMILFIILAIVLLAVRGNTISSTSGKLVMPGLESEVLVERESNGMIHITAADDYDTCYALGVVTYQERALQMELMKRVARGTLAEAVGEPGVESDKFSRTLGFGRVAKKHWNELVDMRDSGVQNVTGFVDCVERYIEGINDALVHKKSELQPSFKLADFEPTPFEPADVIGVQKLMSLDLSGNVWAESERFYLLRELGLSLERIATLWPPITGPTIIQEEDMDQFMPTDYTPPAPAPLFEEELEPRDTGERIDWHAYEKKYHGLSELLGISNSKHPRKPTQASNNWVVNGEWTETGKPFLCNDPHLGLSIPSIWLLLDIESGGKHYIGAALALAPGIIIGRNEHISWGMTNVGTDVQDLYLMEEVAPGSTYMYKGEELDYDVISEEIIVKGGDSITLNVRESVYGPVVNEVFDTLPDKRDPMCLHWVSLIMTDTTGVAYYHANRATNYEEFRAAWSFVTSPGQNAIFADVEGNIGYVMQGHTPIRVPGHSGAYPVSGNGTYDWLGYIPWDNQPHVLNPKEGFVATANSRVVPESYPYNILYQSDFAEAYRTERIREMIEANKAHTVETMRDIQYDRTSHLVRDVLDGVLSSLPDSALNDDGAAAKEMLESWDGISSDDSREATLFYNWWYLITTMAGKEMDMEKWDSPPFILKALKEGDPSCEVDGGSCGEWAASQLNVAAKKAGKHPKKWKDVHSYDIKHLLLGDSPLACAANRVVEAGGGPYTVNVGHFNSDDFTSYSGPSYREIVDLSDMENSKFVLPGGQTGNLFLPHYDDLLKLWTKGEYIPMVTEGYKVAKKQRLVGA